MIFQLRDKIDSALLIKCEPFNFISPNFEPIEFSKNLVETMYYYKGIGLAFNQCIIPGIDKQYSIFAMRGHPENFVCFNPKIVWVSEAVVELEEGCLTYPGLLLKIKRPQHIRVRFNTPNGDVKTEKYTGMTARIFQHECEHLEGKRFIDNVSKLKLDMALKKVRKHDNR